MKNKCVEFLSIMEEKGFDLSPNNYQAAVIALYKVFGADKLLSLKTSVLSSLVQLLNHTNSARPYTKLLGKTYTTTRLCGFSVGTVCA